MGELKRKIDFFKKKSRITPNAGFVNLMKEHLFQKWVIALKQTLLLITLRFELNKKK